MKSWKEERFRVQPDRSLIFQRDILHDNGSPVYRYPDESFLRISAQNRVVASVAASFHGTLSVVERNMRPIPLPLEKPSPRNRRVSRRFLPARNILLNKGGGLIMYGWNKLFQPEGIENRKSEVFQLDDIRTCRTNSDV